jgi:hypothetical protein
VAILIEGAGRTPVVPPLPLPGAGATAGFVGVVADGAVVAVVTDDGELVEVVVALVAPGGVLGAGAVWTGGGGLGGGAEVRVTARGVLVGTALVVLEVEDEVAAVVLEVEDEVAAVVLEVEDEVAAVVPVVDDDGAVAAPGKYS